MDHGPSFYQPVQPAAPAYEWRSFPDDDTQVALMADGVQVGGYSLTKGIYRSLTGTQWGPVGTAPFTPPAQKEKVAASATTKRVAMKAGCDCGPNCKCLTPGDCGDPYCGGAANKKVVKSDDNEPVNNFGMDYKPPTDGLTHYYRNGVEVIRSQAVQTINDSEVIFIGDKVLPNDATAPWLIVIGTHSETAPVIVDVTTNDKLKKILAGYRLKVSPVEGWWVKRMGLDTSGHPTIYREDAAGKFDPAKDVWKEYKGADWFADKLSVNPAPAPKPNPDDPPPSEPVNYSPYVILGLGGVLAVAGVAAMRKKTVIA